jgi:hypothetical protein
MLANTLASTDETNRTVAGMLLVRAATRSLPLLRTNLQRGVAVPLTLRVLGDIGGRDVASDIEPFTRNADPAIARAAADALASITQRPAGQ